MAERVTVRARVTGRVQGVWFRGWTAEQAQALRLDGWVRNEPDGSVSALIAGPPDRVAQLVQALRRGPPAARVVSVETDAVEADAGEVDVGEGFRVVR